MNCSYVINWPRFYALFDNFEDAAGRFVIPDSVESLGDYAFDFCTDCDASEVEIPDSLKTLGDKSISNISHIIVHTKNGMIPRDLFFAISITRNRGNKRPKTYLTVDGTTYILPFGFTNDSELNMYYNYYPFSPEPLYEQFTNIDNKMLRYRFLMDLYEESDDEKQKEIAIKNLKHFASDIINVFVKNGKESDDYSDLARSLSIGFVSQVTLNRLVERAEKENILTVKAYAIEALGRFGKDNTKFEI